MTAETQELAVHDAGWQHSAVLGALAANKLPGGAVTAALPAAKYTVQFKHTHTLLEQHTLTGPSAAQFVDTGP